MRWLLQLLRWPVHIRDCPRGLEKSYRRMAQDTAREAEAGAWIEGTFGDITDEAR